MVHSIDSHQALIEGKTKAGQKLAAAASIYTESGARLVCRWGSIVYSSLAGARDWGLRRYRRNQARADGVAPSVHDPDLATSRNCQQWSTTFL